MNFIKRMRLPKGVTCTNRQVAGGLEFLVEPGVAYPHYFERLGVKNPSQYWLGVARRCVTEDIKAMAGEPVTIRILKDPAWKNTNFPEGELHLPGRRVEKLGPGEGAATGSADFKRHYRRMQAA